MPHPYPYPFWLVDEISRHLGQLSAHLADLPARQATQVIARVLDPKAGVLNGVAQLVGTSGTFAKREAERGAFPPEVWLALGRAANELDAIGDDLDDHREAIAAAGTRPISTAAVQPAPTPLVVRRRR